MKTKMKARRWEWTMGGRTQARGHIVRPARLCAHLQDGLRKAKILLAPAAALAIALYPRDGVRAWSK